MDTQFPSPNFQPSFNELLDYAEGRLAATEQQRMEQMLPNCPETVREELAWVNAFLAKAATSTFHRMPEGLEGRLTALYTASVPKTLTESAKEWAGQIRRVIAELIEPAADTSFATAALRSRCFERMPQQWTFRTAQVDICLNALARADDSYDLHGQIFSVSDSAASLSSSVQLLRKNRNFCLTAVDEYGEFVLANVPTGEYALVLADKRSEVVCTPLRIGKWSN
jgi:hypothetical protein